MKTKTQKFLKKQIDIFTSNFSHITLSEDQRQKLTEIIYEDYDFDEENLIENLTQGDIVEIFDCSMDELYEEYDDEEE